MFCKKGVLKNFAKFTGKHLCRTSVLLKKRFRLRCFTVNFAKLLRTFFIEHFWWLLLHYEQLLRIRWVYFFKQLDSCHSPLFAYISSDFSPQKMLKSCLFVFTKERGATSPKVKNLQF